MNQSFVFIRLDFYARALSVFLPIIILFSITPVVLAQDEYTPLALDLALYSDGTVKVDFLAETEPTKRVRSGTLGNLFRLERCV